MTDREEVDAYVSFILAEYEKDPRGWVTKDPPSLGVWLRSRKH